GGGPPTERIVREECLRAGHGFRSKRYGHLPAGAMGICCAYQSGFQLAQSPSGPVCDEVDTGDTQRWPLHWYQTPLLAAGTHVGGGRPAPCVGGGQKPSASRRPAPLERETHSPPSHSSQRPSVADCTRVPASTSRSSVDDVQVPPVVVGSSVGPVPLQRP